MNGISNVLHIYLPIRPWIIDGPVSQARSRLPISKNNMTFGLIFFQYTLYHILYSHVFCNLSLPLGNTLVHIPFPISFPMFLAQSFKLLTLLLHMDFVYCPGLYPVHQRLMPPERFSDFMRPLFDPVPSCPFSLSNSNFFPTILLVLEVTVFYHSGAKPFTSHEILDFFS